MTLQQLLTLLVIPLAVATIARAISGIKERQDPDGREQWFKDEGMPRELRKATLLLNEQSIQSKSGKIGRPDQVFQLKNGKIVILDTKTRDKHKVYQSDIKQLKRYAEMLQDQGYAKPSHGYVRTVQRTEITRDVHYFKVRL